MLNFRRQLIVNDFNCENSEAPHYVIMDVQFLKGLLKNLLCDVCKSYSLKIDIGEKLGFSRKISVFGTSCDIIKSSNFTSRRISDSEGSSCAMEQEAALKLWQISEDNGFRYTTLLPDSDAKTYPYLNTREVYGPEIKIKKEECVNHVSKRLGTSLRKAVKE
ncbi:uncharacterized protein TNCV_3237211 [Trichonephila clavipes]|nr:uncharacterized protein TNCV_3237211 [Trichonephila clavipes]